MSDELGACLRAWRDRLPPQAVGLAVTGRRRAPGLRRQEVATLAGLSVEYLARLEQGRARNPSASVLAPLARVLRLTDAERDHLLVLAGHAPHVTRAAPRLTPGLLRIVDRLHATPVHVVDDAYDVVHANRLAADLLGEASTRTGANVAVEQFRGSGRVVDEDDHHARFRAEIVATLRASLKDSARRERVRAVVDELLAASPDFAARWARADVGERLTSRHKAVLHPRLGRIAVECDVLRAEDSSLRIVVYTAEPGSRDAQALELLGTVADEALAADR